MAVFWISNLNRTILSVWYTFYVSVALFTCSRIIPSYYGVYGHGRINVITQLKVVKLIHKFGCSSKLKSNKKVIKNYKEFCSHWYAKWCFLIWNYSNICLFLADSSTIVNSYSSSLVGKDRDKTHTVHLGGRMIEELWKWICR